VALRSRGRLALEGTVLALLRGGWLVGALWGLRSGSGVHGIGLGMALASFSALFVALALAWRHIPPRIERSSLRGATGLLREAVPMALTSLITIVYMRLGVLLSRISKGTRPSGSSRLRFVWSRRSWCSREGSSRGRSRSSPPGWGTRHCPWRVATFSKCCFGWLCRPRSGTSFWPSP
jgi:hypothetical protein